MLKRGTGDNEWGDALRLERLDTRSVTAPRGSRLPGIRPPVALVALLACSGAASCGGSEPAGPSGNPPVFIVPPSDTEVGIPITPPVEVATGDGTSATVTVSLANDDCGATLAGSVSRVASGGRAVFPDLVVDIAARGFRLETRVDERVSTSPAFDVRPRPSAGPLVPQFAVCFRGGPQGDAGSLAWVHQDDVLWTTDDNRDQLIGIDRRTGDVVNILGREELLAGFPGAADCDDGDGDPNTRCSYLRELESVAYDPGRRRLYLINTVNDPSAPVILDRPAVFRLTVGSCRGCLGFDAWKELPAGPTYRGVVVVDGQILVSSGSRIYSYDFDANRVSDEPVVDPGIGTITALAFEDGTLYITNTVRRLVTWDWAQERAVGNYDLATLGITTAAGVESINDTLYVLEGEPKNPIIPFTIDPDS